jgi:hypothetical protein
MKIPLQPAFCIFLVLDIVVAGDEGGSDDLDVD